MVVSLVVYAPVAVGVGALGWGIGWLWAAIATLMAARLVTLLTRWRSGAWVGAGPAA
jgi:hypothetical protein